MSELSPRLIVVAGPNGSGKTSITEQLLMHEWMGGCVYVNPDLIARDEFGDWSSEGPVLAAARRAEEIREDCLRKRRSLAFETVLSAPDKLDFLRRGRAAGFFIRLFFIGTGDPSINARRVAMRVMEGSHSQDRQPPLALAAEWCSGRARRAANVPLRQLGGRCGPSSPLPDVRG